MTAVGSKAWIGVDIGKTHHWVCAVDESGHKLLSVKVLNDEAQIIEVKSRVTSSNQGPQVYQDVATLSRSERFKVPLDDQPAAMDGGAGHERETREPPSRCQSRCGP